jgi:hypothetical protein
MSNENFISFICKKHKLPQGLRTSPKGPGKHLVFLGNFDAEMSFYKTVCYYRATLDYLKAFEFVAKINWRSLLGPVIESINDRADELMKDENEYYDMLDEVRMYRTKYHDLISGTQRIILKMMPDNTHLLYLSIKYYIQYFGNDQFVDLRRFLSELMERACYYKDLRSIKKILRVAKDNEHLFKYLLKQGYYESWRDHRLSRYFVSRKRQYKKSLITN